MINSRKIVKLWDKLPEDMDYAAYSNTDKCAINDGIFSEFLRTTHSKNINERLPDHTSIVINASNLKLQIDKTRRKIQR